MRDLLIFMAGFFTCLGFSLLHDFARENLDKSSGESS